MGDVEELVSEVKTRTIFELTDAIGTRNSLEALGILRRMLQAGEAHLKILNMIARQFRLIWKAQDLVSKGVEKEELARRLKLHHFHLESILQQTTAFSEDDLREGFHQLLQADLAMKTTTVPKELLLEKMVVNLCH